MNYFKSITSVVVFAGLVSLTIVSCKDEFSEKDAFDRTLAYAKKKDSAANAQTNSLDSVIVNLTVLSYPSNVGLGGASVGVTQYKGKSGQTSTDGTYHFKMLKGSAQFQLQATDHAAASFLFNYDISKSEPIVFITARLPKLKTDATYTINGTAYAQFDLNSTLSNPVPAGVQVSATMTSGLEGYVNYLFDPRISNISLTGVPSTVIQTTTNQLGQYSLNIPVVTGALYNYRVDFADFTHNQNLAINRFLDGNESVAQHNLFGDFTIASIPTNFTTLSLGTSSNSYVAFPSNVPVFKVEVLQNPVTGTKPIFTAAVVSSSYESSYNQLSVGRIFSLTKITGDGTYTPGTPVTFRITDLRDGTTADVQYPFNYYYYGSPTALPNTITMNPGNTYYYNYAPSPVTSFMPGVNTYNSITSPLGPIAMYNGSYTAGNYLLSNGQLFNATPKPFSIMSYGNATLSVDFQTDRYFALIQVPSIATSTLDVNYGTGIRSRPVE
jgi:hypothetical protein